MTPLEFYPSYINSYIERDVRQLKNIQDLSTFKTFIQLCAGRTGQLLNIHSLSQECGIDHKTTQSWLSVLEASYIIFLLLFILPVGHYLRTLLLQKYSSGGFAQAFHHNYHSGMKAAHVKSILLTHKWAVII